MGRGVEDSEVGHGGSKFGKIEGSRVGQKAVKYDRIGREGQ